MAKDKIIFDLGPLASKIKEEYSRKHNKPQEKNPNSNDLTRIVERLKEQDAKTITPEKNPNISDRQTNDNDILSKAENTYKPPIQEQPRTFQGMGTSGSFNPQNILSQVQNIYKPGLAEQGMNVLSLGPKPGEIEVLPEQVVTAKPGTQLEPEFKNTFFRPDTIKAPKDIPAFSESTFPKESTKNYQKERADELFLTEEYGINKKDLLKGNIKKAESVFGGIEAQTNIETARAKDLSNLINDKAEQMSQIKNLLNNIDKNKLTSNESINEYNKNVNQYNKLLKSLEPDFTESEKVSNRLEELGQQKEIAGKFLQRSQEKESGVGDLFEEFWKTLKYQPQQAIGGTMNIVNQVLANTRLTGNPGMPIVPAYNYDASQSKLKEIGDWMIREAKLKEKELKPKSGFWAELGQGAASVAMMAPMAIAGTIATGNPAVGFVAGFVPSFVLEGGMAYSDAKDYGLNDKDAAMYSLPIGVINGAIEQLTELGIGKEIVRRIGRGVTEELAKKGLLLDIVEQFSKNGFKEGGEEVVQEITNLTAESIYKNAEDRPKIKEWIDRGGKSGLYGYILGGLMAGGSIAGQRIAEKFKIKPIGEKITEQQIEDRFNPKEIINLQREMQKERTVEQGLREGQKDRFSSIEHQRSEIIPDAEKQTADLPSLEEAKTNKPLEQISSPFEKFTGIKLDEAKEIDIQDAYDMLKDIVTNKKSYDPEDVKIANDVINEIQNFSKRKETDIQEQNVQSLPSEQIIEQKLPEQTPPIESPPLPVSTEEGEGTFSMKSPQIPQGIKANPEPPEFRKIADSDLEKQPTEIDNNKSAAFNLFKRGKKNSEVLTALNIPRTEAKKIVEWRDEFDKQSLPINELEKGIGVPSKENIPQTPEEGMQNSLISKPEGETKFAEVKQVPIKNIETDEGRFQNRADAFSEETASSIEKNYNPTSFEPIVLWKDPKDGNDYVLAGHSRLEGMKRRGVKEIPAKYFEGIEDEAINYARIESNRKAVNEDLLADVKAYKRAKEQNYSKAKLLEIFKEESKVKTLDNFSNLDENGEFLRAINSKAAKSFPYIERNSSWIGELRKTYPQLTEAHEKELFDYFYRGKEKNSFIKKEDLFNKVEDRVSDITFKAEQNLALDKLESMGSRARSDTRDITQKVDLLKARNRELASLSKSAPKTQKNIFQKEILVNTRQIQKLESNIGEIINSQIDIFSQLKNEVKNEVIDEDSATQIISTRDTRELKELADDIKRKEESPKDFRDEEIQSTINRAEEVIKPQKPSFLKPPKGSNAVIVKFKDGKQSKLPIKDIDVIGKDFSKVESLSYGRVDLSKSGGLKWDTFKGISKVDPNNQIFLASLLPIDFKSLGTIKKNFEENTETMKNVFAYGAKIINEGYKDYSSWYKKMLKDFGDGIKQSLSSIWNKIKGIGTEIKNEFAKQVLKYAEKKGLIIKLSEENMFGNPELNLDRIAKIENWFELNNWKKRHYDEIMDMASWERDEVIDVWNEQARILREKYQPKKKDEDIKNQSSMIFENKDLWSKSHEGKKVENKYEGSDKPYLKYLEEAGKIWDSGKNKFMTFNEGLKESEINLSPSERLKLYQEIRKRKIKEYNKTTSEGKKGIEEQETMIIPKPDIIDKENERIKQSIKDQLYKSDLPKDKQTRFINFLDKELDNYSETPRRKWTALNILAERYGQVTKLYGKAGGEIANLFAEGNVKEIKIDEGADHFIERPEETINKIKKEKYGIDKFIEYDKKIKQALEDRENADKILGNDKTLKDIYSYAEGFYDYFMDLENKAGYSTTKNYYPRLKRAEEMSRFLDELPVDIKSDTKGLNQFISMTSPHLEHRKGDGKVSPKNFIDEMKDYKRQISRVLAYKDAINYWMTDFKKDIPLSKKTQSLKPMYNFIVANLTPDKLYMPTLNWMRNNMYINQLSFNVKASIQNWGQKMLADAYASQEAIDLTSKFVFDSTKNLRGNLRKAYEEIKYLEPDISRSAKIGEYDRQKGLQKKITEKIGKYELFTVMEKTNWSYAELLGIKDSVVNSKEYKLWKAENPKTTNDQKLDKIEELLGNPKIFKYAIREGRDLAANTQISPTATYRPEMFEKEWFRKTIGMYRRFPVAIIEHTAKSLFGGLEGADGLYAQRILRRGITTEAELVDKLDAFEYFRKKAERYLKELKTEKRKSNTVEEEFTQNLIDHWKQIENNINKELKSIVNIGGRGTRIKRFMKLYGYGIFVTSLFQVLYNYSDNFYRNLFGDNNDKKNLSKWDSMTKKQRTDLIESMAIKSIFDAMPLPFYGGNIGKVFVSPILPDLEWFKYGKFNSKGITKTGISYTMNIMPGLGLVDRVLGRSISDKLTNVIFPKEKKAVQPRPNQFLKIPNFSKELKDQLKLP